VVDQHDPHDYEVTSLRTGYEASRSGAARPAAHAASGSNSSQWSQAARRRPRAPLARGERRLVTSLLTTAGVLLAVLVVLLTSQSGLRDSLGALVHPPTPTFAPLAFGANFFFIEHEAPWGVLRVDGKQQDVLDVSQYGSNADGVTSFALDRGRHSVEYTAAPFAILRCTVSVPADRTDTCPIAPPDQQNAHITGLGAARVLDLRATVDRLPADQLAALSGAVAKLITIKTAPVPVPAGEQYLTTNSVVTATQTLQATLFRQPWNAPSGIPGASCAFLCPPQSGSASSPGNWQLTALVREGFTYATPGGQVVVPAAPLSTFIPSGNSTGAEEDQVQILASWHGGWQVALASPNDPPPTCAAASAELSNAKGFGAVGPGVPQYNPLKPISAADPADGCVLGLQQVDPSSGKSIGQPIYLLYRFGLLLVTDNAGHQLLPGLPFATPRERTIAQQIVAQGH
jgi:hypothetical protein